MGRKFKIILCLFLLFGSTKATAQIDAALSLISSLSDALNQMEVFTSMDESLKTMENIQNAAESIKEPTDWYKRMKHIKTMLVLVEATTCHVSDLDFLYQNYLGSVWTDWDGDGGCLTGLKYEMIMTKAEVIVDMVTELVDSHQLDPGQRDIIALETLKGIQEFVELSTDFMSEMKGKIAMQKRFDYQQATFVSPSSMDTSKYDDISRVAGNILGHSGGLQGIIDSLVAIMLVLGVVPIVISIDNPDRLRVGVLSWVTALVIYIIVSNLIF